MWEALIKRLQPLFARTIYRVASSTSVARLDEVDDLVQDTFLKLKAGIGGMVERAAFDNEAAAVAYFKIMAANTARDHFRTQTADKRDVQLTAPFDDRLYEIVDGSAKNQDRQLLMAQIDSLLEADTQLRTIFWMYYRQGFTAKEIAGIPTFKLTAKGVESLLRRLTIGVRQKITLSAPEGNLRRETFL